MYGTIKLSVVCLFAMILLYPRALNSFTVLSKSVLNLSLSSTLPSTQRNHFQGENSPLKVVPLETATMDSMTPLKKDITTQNMIPYPMAIESLELGISPRSVLLNAFDDDDDKISGHFNEEITSPDTQRPLENVPARNIQEASDQMPHISFPYRKILDENESFTLLWLPQEEKITFEIQANTLGYVGLGFSPNGGMVGSDLVIGWVDSNDQIYFYDRFSFSHDTPSIDEDQNYTLIGGYQKSNQTILRFSRAWNTSDSKNDNILSKTGLTNIIWCYDIEDPIDINAIQRHRYRGSEKLQLLDPKGGETSSPTQDVQFWDVLVDNFNVPVVETFYLCKIVKLAAMPGKTQMIGYQPLIQKGNEQIVHHLIINECHMEHSSLNLEKYVDQPGVQCYSDSLPHSWMSCNTPIVVWSIGSVGDIFPEHVGIPLGEINGGANYFMIQLHYNNPHKNTGVTDNSGIRFLVATDTQRQDAGMLKIGHSVSPTLIIPPRYDWDINGHCLHYCTKKAIPAKGIRVFQGLLHGHTLARSIEMIQVRDGRQLHSILKENHYDYTYQQQQQLHPEMEILPGDDFIVRCHFDATRMTNTTFGGLGTHEEMCLSWLTYYPRINLTGCFSMPDMRLVLNTIGIDKLYNQDILHQVQNTDATYALSEVVSKMGKSYGSDLSNVFKVMLVKSPQKYQNQTVYDILNNQQTWTNKTMMEELQSIMLYSDHIPECNRIGHIPVEQVPTTVKYPKFSTVQPDIEGCPKSG